MPRGVNLRVYAPLKWYKRPVFVLKQPLWVDGRFVGEGFRFDGMSSGWWIWWLLPPIGPEFKRVIVHDNMRAAAKDLAERWAADIVFVRGVRKDGIGIVRFSLLHLVFPHSLYRTIHLFIKDALGIPRKKL